MPSNSEVDYGIQKVTDADTGTELLTFWNFVYIPHISGGL